MDIEKMRSIISLFIIFIFLFVIAVIVLVPIFSIDTIKNYSEQLLTYGSIYSSLIGLIIGYYFKSKVVHNGETVRNVNKIQAIISLAVIACFLLLTSIVTVAPLLVGDVDNIEEYTRHVKAIATVLSSLVGLIAGFYFGR